MPGLRHLWRSPGFHFSHEMSYSSIALSGRDDGGGGIKREVDVWS